MNEQIFPWQMQQWQFLHQRHTINQLPHALLLVGDAGLGKEHFALQFADSLLCESPNEQQGACLDCRGCQLRQAGNHPDLYFLAPEEAGKAIKIDQIREVIYAANQTPQIGQWKIVIVSPADAMNHNAANALLKTLEEPSANTLLLLISDRLMGLPATIRSRCQLVKFMSPNERVVKEWLVSAAEGDESVKAYSEEQVNVMYHLAKRAPLKVLELLQEDELTLRKQLFDTFCHYTFHQLDLIQLSTEWARMDIRKILFHLESWIQDIILLKQLSVSEKVINQDFIENLRSISNVIELQKMYQFLEDIKQASYWIHRRSNLNLQLLIEKLLIQWAEI